MLVNLFCTCTMREKQLGVMENLHSHSLLLGYLNNFWAHERVFIIVNVKLSTQTTVPLFCFRDIPGLGTMLVNFCFDERNYVGKVYLTSVLTSESKHVLV